MLQPLLMPRPTEWGILSNDSFIEESKPNLLAEDSLGSILAILALQEVSCTACTL